MVTVPSPTERPAAKRQQRTEASPRRTQSLRPARRSQRGRTARMGRRAMVLLSLQVLPLFHARLIWIQPKPSRFPPEIVANPGCFILDPDPNIFTSHALDPDPTFFHPGSLILHKKRDRKNPFSFFLFLVSRSKFW
jgi:hypothetical protein